jgi:hypothetical protein
MKKIALLLFISSSAISSSAQRSNEQIIEDSVLGWYTKLDDNKREASQIKGRIFTAKQKELVATVIGWMQKSYIPVGGLGTFQRVIGASETAFNQHYYGAAFRVWSVSFSPEYLDAKGHFKPVSEEYTPFAVYANAIPGSYPIYFINKPNQYLFTWPPNGYIPNERNPKEFSNRDPKIHPNVYKYLPWINEVHTVYLVPGNKLPIVAVTKGEYLKLAEEALDRNLQKEKEKIAKQWPGNDSRNQKSRDDAYNYHLENYDRRFRNTIKQLLEKHKTTLNEPALLKHMQPDIQNFYGDIDPFENPYYPVYKIEADVMQKCNSDRPQWIAVSFPYKTKENGNQLHELYRSLTEHFNYDYVYDYFFNPEKVKGKPYKPANEELLNATLDKYRKKEYTKAPTVVLPTGVHFLDDFSANEINSKPAGWYSSANSMGGGSSIVTTLKDYPGKWIQFGRGNSLNSTSLKLPLPQNFTLDFDVATSDFSGQTGGYINVELTDKANATSISISVGAVNDQYLSSYAGSASLKLQLPRNIKYDAIYAEMVFNDFTSKKRKAHITFKKTGNKFFVFINEKQIPYLDKYKKDISQEYLLPQGTVFNSLVWKDGTTDANDKSYISNIKITKD